MGVPNRAKTCILFLLEGPWPKQWSLWQLNRYIVISFVVMGLGYYELSGGADFEPELRPSGVLVQKDDQPMVDLTGAPAAAEPVTAATVEVTSAPAGAESDPATDALPNVRPVAPEVLQTVVAETMDLRLTIAEDSTEQPLFQSLSEPEGAVFLTDIPAGAAAPSATRTDPAEDVASTPEIASTADVGTQPAGPLQADDDVRWVDASALNVRAGPSTNAAILTSLARSEFVLVISEQADGWALVRIEGDGTEGWVASRYLVR